MCVAGRNIRRSTKNISVQQMRRRW